MSERNYQIIIGILVLVIIIGGWYLAVGRGSGAWSTDATSSTSTDMTSGASANTSATDTSTSVNTSSSSTGTTMTASGDAVSVADQSAGMSVAVKSVSLSQPGWVAVRDSDGRILGAAWFPMGTMGGVSVPLLRATVAGAHYQVLMYADDGNKSFDLHKETLITNADGSVAGTTFTAN